MKKNVIAPLIIAGAVGLAEVAGHTHEPHDEVKIQLPAQGLIGVRSMISNSTATANVIWSVDSYVDFR